MALWSRQNLEVSPETASGFPFSMFYKADRCCEIFGASVFMFLFDSGVWNACIILFMCLFILFLIDKKIAVK